MKRNQIRRIQAHFVPCPDGTVAERIARFHAQLIEHRLDQADLSDEQRIELLDQILQLLKKSTA